MELFSFVRLFIFNRIFIVFFFIGNGDEILFLSSKERKRESNWDHIDFYRVLLGFTVFLLGLTDFYWV